MQRYLYEALLENIQREVVLGTTTIRKIFEANPSFLVK